MCDLDNLVNNSNTKGDRCQPLGGSSPGTMLLAFTHQDQVSKARARTKDTTKQESIKGLAILG